MSLPIVFRRAARAEFDDAADWYEQRRAGLGVGVYGSGPARPESDLRPTGLLPASLPRHAGGAGVGLPVLRLLPRGTRTGGGSVGLSHLARSVYLAGPGLTSCYSRPGRHAALRRTHEQPVLTTNGDPLRLTFRHVVVDGQKNGVGSFLDGFTRTATATRHQLQSQS